MRPRDLLAVPRIPTVPGVPAALAVLALLAAGCGASQTTSRTASQTTSRTASQTTSRTAGQTTSGTAGQTTTRAPAETRTRSTVPAQTVIPVTTTPPPPTPPRKPVIDPGTLPQTEARPSADTQAFDAEMRALWDAIATGDAAAGRSAFFPEAAYLQVKTVTDARGDFRDRLLGDYAIDIAAAHALLGAHPGTPRLLRVEVPASYAHWVPPGVCANRVGYWEVPNARVVYLEAGTVRSVGIASMISWRGVWYVVHLGAVLRSGSGGEVDEPEIGPGVSVPSSTC